VLSCYLGRDAFAGQASFDKRLRVHPCVTALVLVARFSGFKDKPLANALGDRDVRILW
jgi:hypothetical protein